jgi:hypothetical protein
VQTGRGPVPSATTLTIDLGGSKLTGVDATVIGAARNETIQQSAAVCQTGECHANDVDEDDETNQTTCRTCGHLQNENTPRPRNTCPCCSTTLRRDEVEERPCTTCRWIWLLQHNTTAQRITKEQETLRQKKEAETETRRKEEEEREENAARNAKPNETATSQKQAKETDEEDKENMTQLSQESNDAEIRTDGQLESSQMSMEELQEEKENRRETKRRRLGENDNTSNAEGKAEKHTEIMEKPGKQKKRTTMRNTRKQRRITNKNQRRDGG